MSPLYPEYYDKYMQNRVTVESLEKLVKAKKLTQQELDTMIADRLEKYGRVD